MNSILLIEDDPMLIKLYENALTRDQFSVSIASDGLSGINKALAEHPDLILLDIGLPLLNGLNVMKKLRQDNWGASVPIIMLTNADTNDEILNAVVEGKPAYYFIKAETNPEGIITKIKETLNIRVA